MITGSMDRALAYWKHVRSSLLFPVADPEVTSRVKLGIENRENGCLLSLNYQNPESIMCVLHLANKSDALNRVFDDVDIAKVCCREGGKGGKGGEGQRSSAVGGEGAASLEGGVAVLLGAMRRHSNEDDNSAGDKQSGKARSVCVHAFIRRHVHTYTHAPKGGG